MKPFSNLVMPRGILTPKGLLMRGIASCASLVIAHLAGWREYTSVLCGTMPDPSAAPWHAGYLGAAYAVCYLLATVIAPILILAAALLWMWKRWRRREGRGLTIRSVPRVEGEEARGDAPGIVKGHRLAFMPHAP
jgi:hypothetical protein